MDCPICLNKKSSTFLVELECHHKLCRSCAVQWLIKNPTCPCCRQLTYYFSKSTRSLRRAHSIVKEANHLWTNIVEMYNGHIPVNIFAEFIRYFFLDEKNRSIWYRPEMTMYKKYFKNMSNNVVGNRDIYDRSYGIMLDFLHSFP